MLKGNNKLAERGIKEVIYYSDTCGGQQRNINFSAMALYCVTNLPPNKIRHNYFERGHSQMEGVSVHARIEKETKFRDIYTPAEWMSAVANAKLSEPRYKVIELETDDIFDFKKLVKETCITGGFKKDVERNVVNWTKIHSMEYRKDFPGSIFFKYSLSDTKYRRMDITNDKFVKETRNVKKKSTKNINGYQLQKLYEEPPKISSTKYKDFIKLCQNGHIPSNNHREFYRTLQHEKIRDALPEPDKEESDVETDRNNDEEQ